MEVWKQGGRQNLNMIKPLGLIPQRLSSQSPLTSRLLDLICNGKFGVSSSVLLLAHLTVKGKSTVFCLDLMEMS